jgi:crotonobetainyl-CoA:carnitine CoA-transferase CaiB-like acyl-CoA transferase
MPLSRFRILQIGSGVALDYCGKLFADFGADVIKLEPPGGDPLRTLPPIVNGGESGYFAWLNTNKRSVTETPATVLALLKDADVLLDGRGYDGTVPDGVSVTRLSWFGEHGPYASYAGTDAIVRALGGLVALTGRAEGPPTLATDHQSSIVAALAAFIATAAGLFDRRNGSRRFSISTHEAAVNVAEYEAAVAWDAGTSRRRPGVNRFGRNYPVGIYPTRHGLVGVTIVTPGQWRGMCAMMGMPELAKNPRYAINVDRLAHAKEIDALFDPVWHTKTAAEWFVLALEHKLPIVMVPTMEELLELDVHRARGAFGPVRIGDAAFDAPVLPKHLTRSPPRSGGTAPLAGEDEAKWHTPPNDWPPHAAPADRRPLEGVRIVDLTMGWAGPTAARHLSDLGAEILKVEACQYPDWWRGTDLRAEFIAQQKYEKILWFQLMNRNKLGITLDLTNPEGADLLKRLVAESDAVIENYSSEVLVKLGLDYSVLSRVNPNVIMLSMPAFGSNNKWSACRGYGSTLEQASGLPTVTGFPDDPPTMNQTAYGDPVGGFNAAAALMAALLHRQETGEGQNIDLSQVECMIPFVAPELISQSALGHTPDRIGNRHAVHVPHGCFRCAGDDRWIAVAVTDDAAWRALCAVMQRSDLADLSVAQRRAREEELEAVLAAWTLPRDADEIMAKLQRVGVAAGVVRVPMDLDRDPHLAARGFWHRHDRPFIGEHWHSSAPFREGKEAYPVRHVAPTLGQHNDAILRERLGLSAAEIQRLAEADIIGTIPKPRRAQSDA